MSKFLILLRESQFARFLIPAGILLIVFGIVSFTINKNNQNYLQTEAVVISAELAEAEHTDADGNHVDATYTIIVKYTVDGKEYETLLGELPGYKVGDMMKIYYNPDDPSQITQTKSMVLPIVIIVAGVAVLAGGIVIGVRAVGRYNRLKEQEAGWAQ